MDAERIHERRWLVLPVLCLSLLLIVMDNTIVNVALPTLQRTLPASQSQLQWIVDAYILVFAGLLLTAGSLGDRFGRKGALSLGLAIMGVGSSLSALSDSPGQLIGTRALMGVGAALVMPATLSILTNVFTDRRERARAIAIWAGTAGMAGALGPLTGGFLLEHFWWGAVFFINVPVVAIALIAGYFIVPTSRDPAPQRVDPVGAALSIAGLATLVWAIIQAGERGWTDPAILAAFAVAAALLASFLAWERHSDHPMLDTTVFANPRFSAASTAITLTFFAMFGSLFLLTQYYQVVLGYTPLGTGVRLLPMAAVMMITAPTSAVLAERVGTKRVVGTGLCVIALSLVLMSFLTVDSSYVQVVVFLCVLAVGMGLTMAPATESIMGSLPLAKAGVGSAVNDTTRQVGGALGVAVLGSLLASSYRSTVGDAVAGKGLPPDVLAVVTDRVGGAVAAANRIGGTTGDFIATTARHAFVDAMGVSLLVGAGVALVGALAVFKFLPARAPEPATVVASEDREPALAP